MPKYRFRESIKSLFGSHIDAEKDEELKGTKIDMDDKVDRILKLLKDEDLEEKDSNMVENSKREPLAELIKDFHKQYQSLYAEYDNLTGVLKKKIRGKQDKDGSSSSSSDSDSEHSSNDKNRKNGSLESDYQKIADVKQELESAHLEVADLKRKLMATSEEKEALNVEYMTALSKNEETEKISQDLKTEAERLDIERVKLLTENSELNLKLEAGGRIEAELSHKVVDLERERDNLIEEKETALRKIGDGENISADLRTLVDQLKDEKATLEQELVSVKEAISNMKHQLESSEEQLSEFSNKLKAKEEETLKLLEMSNEIQQAQNMIQDLKDEASQLKEKLNQNENEYSTLSEVHEVHEKETSTRIKGLETVVTELEQELESLRGQKREIEVKIENKETEAEKSKEENARLQTRFTELESLSREREAELSVLMKKLEDHSSESILLKENLGQREIEYSTLSETHELHGKKTSAQIQGLEAAVAGLELELESLRGQKRDMEVEFENREKQLAEENATLQAQISELESVSKEREAELPVLMKKVEDHISEAVQLKEKLGQREIEYSTLSETHELHGNKTSAQIQGLEAAVAGLELELESLRGQKRDMEVEFESKEKQLGEELAGLLAQVSELKSMSEERAAEISALTKKLEDTSNENSQVLEQLGQREKEYSSLSEKYKLHEDNTAAQIKELEERVMELQLELESFRGHKNDLELEIQSKETEANQLREENAGLQSRISELESITKDKESELFVLTKKLEESNDESSSTIADLIAQINSLKEDIATKTIDHQKILEEKERLLAGMKDLEVKVESMQNQINELEEDIRSKIIESDQLKAEILELKDQFSVFENTIAEREVDFSSLREKHESGQNESSAQMVAFVAQVNGLQQELESLQTQKNQIELHFEKEKQELLESLTLLETDKIELTSKVTDLQKLLNEREDSYSKFIEEHKQLEGEFQECKDNIESKDHVISDLEQLSEDLKRDLEEKSDELSSLVDKSRNTEVKLRLSNQKLRVTEQVLTEKEQNFRIAELKYQEEQRVLEERIAALSGIISANNEAYQRNITCVSDSLNSSLIAMETLIKKFVDDYAKYEKCIVVTSQQLQTAKKWVAETNDEREKLKREVENLSMQLRDKKGEAMVFREKVEKLETDASKEQVEKGSLVKTMNRFEKNVEELKKMVEVKNQGLLDLGEEKREAIRQLCIWIEYHQSRYDYLKEVLSKMAPRSQRRA